MDVHGGVMDKEEFTAVTKVPKGTKTSPSCPALTLLKSENHIKR